MSDIQNGTTLQELLPGLRSLSLEEVCPECLIPVEYFVASKSCVIWAENAADAIQAIPLILPCDEHTQLPSLREDRLRGSAELYGGKGLAGNLGGVRSGNYRDQQAKGVGKLPLGGRSTDRWHQHGALSIQDAIKEVIFERIFACVKKDSTVRSRSIVDLYTVFATEIGKDKLPGEAQRALLYRDRCVRIGHFLPGLYADPNSPLFSHERGRLRAGPQRLVGYLEHLDTGRPDEILALIAEEILDCLARLRVLRLVHGSLIPSNLTLGAQILDFSTATAVATHDAYVITPGGVSSDRQYEFILDAHEELLFSLCKFGGLFGSRHPVLREVVTSHRHRLTASYDLSVSRYYLRSIGFASCEIDQCDNNALDTLLSQLKRILFTSSLVCEYYGFAEDVMPSNTASYRLIQHVADALHAHVLSADISDEHEFVSAYRAVLRCVGARQDRSSCMFRLVSALRWHADISDLYRFPLDLEIDKSVQGHADTQETISRLSDAMCIRFALAENLSQRVDGWLYEAPPGTSIAEDGDEWHEVNRKFVLNDVRLRSAINTVAAA